MPDTDPGLGTGDLIWVAYLGAAMSAGLVYLLGSVGRAGATPLKLVLAGVVIGSFLLSFTSAILLVDAQTMEDVRFWTMGSLRNRSLAEVLPLIPFLLGGVGLHLS